MSAARYWLWVTAIGLAACDCEGEPEMLGESDASVARDVLIADVLIADVLIADVLIADALIADVEDGGIADDDRGIDAGIVDTGIFDAGAPDVGELGCGRIEVSPPDTLAFGPSPSRGSLRIDNVGACPLYINNLTITGPQGDPASSSADDFLLISTFPFSLCVRDPVSCPDPVADLMINYTNNDISTLDFAELHIFTDDPTNPEYVVVLSGSDTPCFQPLAQINVLTPMPQVGMPVFVDGSQSSPSSPTETITSYSWSFLFTPGAVPLFTPPNVAQTSFTPTEPGIYVMQLTVGNSCGSFGSATETIMVP